MRTEYKDYDYVIDGIYAVEFVAAVKKYSDFDTSAIEQAILNKVDYYVEKFPDEHESENAEEIKVWIKKKFEIE